MANFLVGLFGKRMARKAMAQHPLGRALNVKFGLSLLKNRSVPLRFKLLALGLGAALMAGIVWLELPVETLFALIGGLPIDIAFDGMEAVVGPILFGALLLPFLAPAGIVEAHRARLSLPQA